MIIQVHECIRIEHIASETLKRNMNSWISCEKYSMWRFPPLGTNEAIFVCSTGMPLILAWPWPHSSQVHICSGQKECHAWAHSINESEVQCFRKQSRSLTPLYVGSRRRVKIESFACRSFFYSKPNSTGRSMSRALLSKTNLAWPKFIFARVCNISSL